MVVFRTRQATTPTGELVKVAWSTTVLLSYLADFMTDDRKVSRPRRLIAKELNTAEATIKRGITEANKAGLLSTVVRGQKGVTAVYQGTFPGQLRGTRTDPLNAVRGTRADPLKTSDSVPLNGPDQAFRGTRTDPPVVTADQVWTDCEPCGGHGCELCCAEPLAPIHNRRAS